MSITVTRRLHAIAASGRRSAGPIAVMSVPAGLRPAAVQDPDRYIVRDRGQDRARMQHLGAEVRQLRRLGERQIGNDARTRERCADRR